MKNITIKGASVHNLKGIDISSPKNKLIADLSYGDQQLIVSSKLFLSDIVNE